MLGERFSSLENEVVGRAVQRPEVGVEVKDNRTARVHAGSAGRAVVGTGGKVAVGAELGVAVDPYRVRAPVHVPSAGAGSDVRRRRNVVDVGRVVRGPVTGTDSAVPPDAGVRSRSRERPSARRIGIVEAALGVRGEALRGGEHNGGSRVNGGRTVARE